MWLISLETLLMLYGEGSHGHVMDVHQKLRDKFLTPWHSVPGDAEIIFVSTSSSLTQVAFNELKLLFIKPRYHMNGFHGHIQIQTDISFVCCVA